MATTTIPQIFLEPPYLIIKPDASEDDFYRHADEDLNAEFLNGRIVMYSPASNLHEDLFSFLMALMRMSLDATGQGIVRGSRFPMRLNPRWSPEPDLMVVRQERLHLLGKQRLEGPADLVIEIISEHHAAVDYDEKRPEYQRHRIPELWFVDQEKREVLVDVWSETGYTTRTLSAGRLDSAVVPGFWVDAAWLWQDPLPSTVACFRQIHP